MALDTWVNSSQSTTWNYDSSTVAKVYHGHLNELKQIKAKKPTSYHAILRKFFSNCAYVFVALLSFATAQKILQYKCSRDLHSSAQEDENRLRKSS